MAKKTFTIEFKNNAFNDSVEKNRLTGSKYIYNKSIKELNDTLDKLDRFDDFAELKISPQNYSKEADSKYGIEYNELIHRRADELILPHQQESVREFLKRFRGFGLLADVVGSGKTYEAGVVLSELSIRKRIKSMLVIVPEQVFEKWVKVLENEFGIGENILYQAGPNLDKSKLNYSKLDNRPTAPIIVKDSDFETWKESTTDLLFDIIIVDEAHNLCNDEHSYGMKLLSLMMKKKREAGSGSTYCLLLSATPHSGNLDKMFRLWYFVKFKGGNPKDFDAVSDVSLNKQYLDAKAYYSKVVCHNSLTVMEYINNLKIEAFDKDKSYKEKFKEFLLNPYKEDTNLFKEDLDVLKNVSIADYETGKPFFKLYLINLFLKDNIQIRNKIEKYIATSYHDTLLGSFMIRGKKDKELSRKVTNYFYYPLKNKFDKIEFFNKDSQRIRVDLDKLYSEMSSLEVFENNTINKYTLEEYCNRGYLNFAKDNKIDLLNNILHNFNENGNSKELFSKNDYLSFYYNTIQQSINKGINTIVKGYEYLDDSYEHKFVDLVNILKKHHNERVIIYFDYQDGKNKSLLINQIRNRLLAEEEFKNRVITKTIINEVLEEYDKISNAIFVCGGKEFTEGTDLQKGNVIINFEVTPDPLSMNQRIGRIARLGQENQIHIYSLANLNSLEGFGLAYLSRIGIMSSNDNDATIISGSSHEKMIALRCNCCNSVRLVPEEEYAYALSTNDLAFKLKTILCLKTSECKDPNRSKLFVDEITGNSTYATVMTRVLNKDFRCNGCGTLFRRDPKRGYVCMAPTQNTIMRADIKDINRLYCNKACVVSHCQRHTTGDFKDCKAVKMYNHNKLISNVMLRSICDSCEHNNDCPEQCRPYNDSALSVEICKKCPYGSKSNCNLGPHFVEFNDFSTGICPICRKNKKNAKLVGVPTNTFNEFIRSSWVLDHTKNTFVSSLENEIDRVSEIQLVLETAK